MSLRYLRSVLLKNLYLKNHLADGIPKAIIYGGGLKCRYYLTERFTGIEENPIDVIGIIDDQPAIRGQYVYGFKIMGNINDLQDIYHKTPFDKLIISSNKITDDKRRIAKEFCIKNNIKITEVIFRENEI